MVTFGVVVTKFHLRVTNITNTHVTYISRVYSSYVARPSTTLSPCILWLTRLGRDRGSENFIKSRNLSSTHVTLGYKNTHDHFGHYGLTWSLLVSMERSGKCISVMETELKKMDWGKCNGQIKISSEILAISFVFWPRFSMEAHPPQGFPFTFQ